MGNALTGRYTKWAKDLMTSLEHTTKQDMITFIQRRLLTNCLVKVDDSIPCFDSWKVDVASLQSKTTR